VNCINEQPTACCCIVSALQVVCEVSQAAYRDSGSNRGRCWHPMPFPAVAMCPMFALGGYSVDTTVIVRNLFDVKTNGTAHAFAAWPQQKKGRHLGPSCRTTESLTS
jgi:hypothetical protein